MKDTDLRNRFNNLSPRPRENIVLFGYGMVADALAEIDDLRAERGDDRGTAKARIRSISEECERRGIGSKFSSRPFEMDLWEAFDAEKARVAVLEAECGVSREIVDANGFPYHNYDPSLGPRLKAARAATGKIGGGN
jgi:hypothetical protein